MENIGDGKMVYPMDGIGEKIFVFVVCGAKVHTDTLNLSLPFLQKRTQYRIMVVTDLYRNEGKINHPDFIDIKTPEAYNHHQACIPRLHWVL